MDRESAMFGETMMEVTPPPHPLSPAPLPPQCPELDLSVTLSPERPEHPNRPAASAGALRREHTQPRHVRFDVNPRPRPNRACSVDAGDPHSTGERAQSDGQLEEGAALNTTLALRAELQQLEEAEFDGQKAVQEKLQNSTVTQEYIRTRASEALNFPRSQHLYRALVSVSLSHDQIINQVLQDRPTLAPPTASYKFRSRPAEGPDLLTFYSPQQLFRETPLLPGDQVPPPRSRPDPRPAHTTFHLHQRQRQWEA